MALPPSRYPQQAGPVECSRDVMGARNPGAGARAYSISTRSCGGQGNEMRLRSHPAMCLLSEKADLQALGGRGVSSSVGPSRGSARSVGDNGKSPRPQAGRWQKDTVTIIEGNAGRPRCEQAKEVFASLGARPARFM